MLKIWLIQPVILHAIDTVFIPSLHNSSMILCVYAYPKVTIPSYILHSDAMSGLLAGRVTMTVSKGQNDCWHRLLAHQPVNPMTRIAFLLLCVLIAKSHLLTLHCLKPHQYILLNNGGAKDSLSLLGRKRLGGVSLFFARSSDCAEDSVGTGAKCSTTRLGVHALCTSFKT